MISQILNFSQTIQKEVKTYRFPLSSMVYIRCILACRFRCVNVSRYMWVDDVGRTVVSRFCHYKIRRYVAWELNGPSFLYCASNRRYSSRYGVVMIPRATTIACRDGDADRSPLASEEGATDTIVLDSTMSQPHSLFLSESMAPLIPLFPFSPLVDRCLLSSHPFDLLLTCRDSQVCVVYTSGTGSGPR